jgi:hypothetical protein
VGLVDKAKRVASAGGAAVTAYSLLVRVEGRPIRERDKPAKVKVAGIPMFERDAELNRYLFGFIPLGKRKSR